MFNKLINICLVGVYVCVLLVSSVHWTVYTMQWSWLKHSFHVLFQLIVHELVQFLCLFDSFCDFCFYFAIHFRLLFTFYFAFDFSIQQSISTGSKFMDWLFLFFTWIELNMQLIYQTSKKHFSFQLKNKWIIIYLFIYLFGLER